MALINFGYRVDMNTVTPPVDPTGYIVAYDLDGILKQKDYYGNISTIGGTGSSGTASLNIYGATNSLVKFGTNISLTQSYFFDYDFGSGGGYGNGVQNVRFISGGNSWLRLERSQSYMDFILGNPGFSQPNILYSNNNIDGFSLFSNGPIKLGAGLNANATASLMIGTMGQLSIPIIPATGSNSDYFLMRGASGSITQIDYNSVLYTTLTRAEILVKISNSSLVPGSLYKITGVSNLHYGGTDIVLTAIDNNTLSLVGTGKFYNPIYYNSGMNGSGIWTDLSKFNIDSVTGVFETGETITADNSATAVVYSMIQNGDILIKVTGGDWSTAVSFTGDTNGGSANILSIVYISSHSIGDKVIWGGRVWNNLNGNLGSTPLNSLDLDGTEWEIVTYLDTNYYTEVWDAIEYDIDNDFLVSRHNINNNVKVVETYKNYLDNVGTYDIPSIVVIPWGNYIYDGFEFGLQNISVSNSYADLINYRGDIFRDIIIEDSVIYNTAFNDSTIENCVFIKCEMVDSKITSSILINNRFENSSITNLIFSASSLTSTIFLISNLDSVVVSSATTFSSSYLSLSTIYSSVFISCNFFNNLLLNSNFSFGNTVSSFLIAKTLQKVSFYHAVFSENITSASVIFGNYSKDVVTRQDGTVRIKYLNNSDTQVVTAITT